jgi:CBS domain-containing protein
MTVEELMSRDVITVQPDTPLKEVAELLCEHRISGVPVVSDRGLVGILSQTDIVAKERGRLAPKRFARKDEAKRRALTAGEAMSAPPVVIEPWRSASSAAALMLERGVSRLPVVDGSSLVGIVTGTDLVRAFARTDQEIEREIREVLTRSFWLDVSAVTVTVASGHVTVEGEVDTQAVGDILPTAIERVPGVVSVDVNVTWTAPLR